MAASETRSDELQAVDPRSGTPGRSYATTSPQQIRAFAAAAAAACEDPGWQSAALRASALERIAERLQARGEAIIEVCAAETGLREARLRGELERTWRQVLSFAQLLHGGTHYEVTIDPADPDALPAPRPDLRRMMVAIGPVAVFAASNFPLAFSVAGGDTASALAAGCPVICKAHPGHPGTSELVAAEISGALADLGLPAGAFALVSSGSIDVALALVRDEAIEAIAFTGSNAGGRAVFDAAAARPRPIPVFAEMGSVNPFVITDAALRARGEEIAAALAGAITRDAGQLCTKPGLIFIPAGTGADSFQQLLGAQVAQADAGPMLNERIYDSALSKLNELSAHAGVTALATADASPDATARGFSAAPAVFTTTSRALREDLSLSEERFGPIALVVSYDGVEDLLATIELLGGQLTATLHAEDSDEPDARRIAQRLLARVGRLVYDGVPTGVSVTTAMHHGGPYPSTTTPAFTSVGAGAIRRFLRPITWQNAPQWLLPEPLRDGNPLGLPRVVDGVVQAAPKR